MKQKLLANWLWASICAITVGLLTVFGLPGHPETNDLIYAMPMGSVATYACQRLQAGIEKYFGDNIAELRTLGSTSFIKWLLSPQNTSGFTKISEDIKGVPGKKRGVAFRVDDPYCFTLCALATTCETSTWTYVDPETKEIVFDMTNPPFRHCDGNGAPVKLRFSEEDLEKYCTETNTDYIQRHIYRYLLQWEKALDKALTTVLSTHIGTTATPAVNDGRLHVPLFTGANSFNPSMSVLNPEGLWAIKAAYKAIGMEKQFALIGGTIADKYAQFQKWVTANDAGVDMSKANPINPYLFYNRNFETTFGERDMILFTPGAQQLVTWNKYKGERQRGVTDLYSKGTITMPTTGLEVDWKWWYDYECEKWTFEAFLHAELATVPPGGCGEDMEGVNGLIRVRDCSVQPLIPECPEAPGA